ncbi:helix-turn-helix domain-containing protein [Streptomyces sp900105245]|uniref:Helix-turn-helix domain-containing protein n=1 Tax=Streptomyces sp. 900105245 TaxID=3154379 RepID=A0ABV1UKN8_9ACTN
MKAAELFEEKVGPSEVARRLRVSVKSAHQWHQLWREGDVTLCFPSARAEAGVACPHAAWRNSASIWSRGRPCTAGRRTRCGPLRG